MTGFIFQKAINRLPRFKTTADGTVETDSLTASTQVFATLQRRTIEEWPFCEQNNTLLGFTALFTHHNYPPHFEEVGENSLFGFA